MNIRAGIAIISVLIIGMGVYFLVPREAESPVEDEVPAQTTEPQENYNVSHIFEDGVHTISGTLTLPTPCHEVRQDVAVAESFPEQVFITIDIAATDGICIQVIDERDFSIDVEVDEAATFSLEINSVAVAVPALAE